MTAFSSYFLKRITQSERDSSSGLARCARPEAFRAAAAASLPPKASARELERVFRLCEKAARIRAKNGSGLMRCLLKKRCEMPDILMIAESTFGFGEKAEAGTGAMISGSP